MTNDVLDDLQSQLDEIEMLQSMFPDENELVVDMNAVDVVRKWLITPRDVLPPQLDLTIKVNIELENSGSIILETLVTLPHDYPSQTLPEIYSRSDSLSRIQQSQLNIDLNKFIQTDLIPQEPCIVGVIAWLQENGAAYCDTQSLTEETETKEKKIDKFCRYWIYSHHIYSKVKRKNILDLASEFCLTGFCQPGKPGIICVEGSARNCQDWWSLVRSWNWQRINVKIHEELEDYVDESQRLFGKFEEVGVLKNTERSNHMDMGEFQKYLESHNCQWVFKELFTL